MTRSVAADVEALTASTQSLQRTIVDLTDVPTPVQAGDPVVLVGRQGAAQISVSEFSTWGDTIAWETLCSVTKRVPRHYRNASGF